FGSLAVRLKQPSVLGELFAGVLLGSSGVGLIPADGELHHILALLAEIGVVVLLFEIGLETNLREMVRVGRQATNVALVGVAGPFILGFATWKLWNPAL